MTERHLVFESAGERLVGVVHQPAGPPRAGLVFLHGWPGYRIGTHRMAVAAARQAGAQGFACLRFDFRGRGDSGGETSTATLSTMIDDALRAADMLRREASVEVLAYIGDCSGCEVAIGAGDRTPGLQAMVLWSAPIVGGSRAAADTAKRRGVLSAYARKMFSPSTWRKLARGAVRWDMVRRALSRGGKGAGEEGAPSDAAIDWRARFLSFGGPRLFIYGGADPVTPACIEAYRRLCADASCEFELYVVEGANHAFYSADWETEVITVTLRWLDRCFPTRWET
ncbi:MAG: alpha/beta fold hydrolase [Armatimonadetes bacterium]|nr:alpha/beta fold hydrolase [Armatimonadota bacterium]